MQPATFKAVVTWGDASSGGDSLEVWEQLADGVVDLSHTSSAFAARKEDGSVVPGPRSSAPGCWDSLHCKSHQGLGEMRIWAETPSSFLAKKSCSLGWSNASPSFAWLRSGSRTNSVRALCKYAAMARLLRLEKLTDPPLVRSFSSTQTFVVDVLMIWNVGVL